MMTSPAAATSTFAATTATSGSGSASTTSPTSSTSSASTLTQSDFLQLLTAQLKYQTPNSPADPTQLASEFAAISTVDGISQLNSSLSSIRSGGAAAQIAQAAALVGKQVAVTGDTLTTNTTGTGTGAFTLAAAAQDVQVSIMNPGGAVAATLDLGAMPAGQQSFSWGGGAANTAYTYGVNATDAAGAGVSATPYSVYTVQGVNVSGATPTLNVQGTAAPLAVSAVQTILGASQ
jgi:flagellar basal-body rod modification protein FlgD